MMTRYRRFAGIAGTAMLAATLHACGGPEPSVAEALTAACEDARRLLAAAPTPVDAEAEAAFIRASRQATQTVADVADDQAARGDDRSIADLAWQLHRFPGAISAEEALGTAHEAQAAITRIDGFARTLLVGDCAAPTWRPDDWRVVADRHSDRPDNVTFRRRLDDLCAETFPNPSLIADGVPLLNALIADTAHGGSPDDVRARLIARLNTVTSGPSQAARFIRDFSSALRQIHPPADLEREYIALLAAFLRLDAAVPSAMPRDPPPHVRERVNGALEELDGAWEALEITC